MSYKKTKAKKDPTPLKTAEKKAEKKEAKKVGPRIEIPGETCPHDPKDGGTTGRPLRWK